MKVRRSAAALLAAATWVFGASVDAAAAGPPSGGPPATPVRSCESLVEVALPNTTIDSAVTDPGDAQTPPSCRVQASVTHPPYGDDVNVWIYLPAERWNGRFQGVGGGGFAGGDPERLLEPLREGYAAGATDAGHEGGSGTFVLDEDNTINWQRVQDFGYLGIHEMTVVGKALVDAYYGDGPRYSYFNGCSTGGRQGIMEAQRYPSDYDGILAGAPAINWTRFQIAQFWGQLVMLEEDNPVPMCKFEAAVAAAVEACDELGDGIADGVIGNPVACRFDAASLVGAQTECGEITAADAAVINRIWEGARRRSGEFLWYGLPKGAPFAGLHDTEVVAGTLVGRPFIYDLWWIGWWLLQDPTWDWRTITYEQYERLFDQSVEMYTEVLGTEDPDLRAFRDRGGKILMWHGLADFGIFPQGSVDYFERVAALMGGLDKTERFLRLFLAPGVGHCRGGEGPQPTGQLDALVAWVERGVAPDTILGERRDEQGAVVQTRPICRYPSVARYTGAGDPDDASSYRCVKQPRMLPLRAPDG
jgi:tannase/feruloyl esterase